MSRNDPVTITNTRVICILLVSSRLLLNLWHSNGPEPKVHFFLLESMARSIGCYHPRCCRLQLFSTATANCACTRTNARSYPLGQKMLEMVPEPMGDCLKLWVMKSSSCFYHSPRSHIGDAFWNSEPDSRHQFSQCFWSAFFWFSGKCVFVLTGWSTYLWQGSELVRKPVYV